ncbi:hypothetical protein RN001_012735 [Aquatica leii]|uniref:Fucosyltransferase n=1 Tax=Aquatica leii TaxID=1421715 RepID=A0AAN7SMK9_9COLE|nr:hypothetical protein RN001_012735 [Aquatica leii]
MVTPNTSFAQVATALARIPIQAVQAIGPEIKSINVKKLKKELLPRLVDALKAVFALRKDSTEEVTSTKLTLDINRENKKRKDDQRTPPEEKGCIEGSQPSFSQQKDTNMVKKPRGWPKVNIDEFDAIVFHGSIYDTHIHEAPANKFSYNPNYTFFSSFYNWTITYRLDSDIILRYGHVGYKKRNYQLPSVESIEKKTKLAAWFVSHCNTSSKREDLVKEMQKYIPVDIYGSCGNLSCPRIGYMSTRQCYTMVQHKYKFYLSFENSLCKDYFTEKLYFILNLNVIPVVYGGNDDTVLAPPKSFINIRDFKTVQELTDYLKFLDTNTTEYLKYFEWRKRYFIYNSPSICDLCNKLNEFSPSKTYDKFDSWQWGTKKHPNCIIDDFPPIVKNVLK